MSEEKRHHPSLWMELRGHPAFQGAVVFSGAFWLALQAADIFGLPTRTVRTIGILLIAVLLLLVGCALVAVVRGQAHTVVARARTRAFVVATAALLALGTGAWLARPYEMPPLRAGAEVIAVLPFNVSGADLDVLSEGLVDLLSANLNEVGEIRTINPRTTLHAFNEVAPGGPASPWTVSCASDATRSAYGRFFALWRNADPAMRPHVEHVENVLLRITGERAAT